MRQGAESGREVPVLQRVQCRYLLQRGMPARPLGTSQVRLCDSSRFGSVAHVYGRPLCKYQQENTALFESHPEIIAPTAPGLPNILEMQSYLRDFTEAHRPSFQGLLHAKMLSMGGTKKVLTKENPQICLIPLTYCPPGPDGVNPALTFAYSNCFFLPRARVLADAAEHRPRFLEAWAKSAESRAHVAATFGHGDPDFVDILPVLFAPHHGPAQFGYFPQYSGFRERAPPSPAEVAAQLHLYATFIELGVVLRQPDPSAAPILGYMRKIGDGKKWEWRAMWANWLRDPEWTRAKTKKDRVKLLKRKLAEAQRDAS